MRALVVDKPEAGPPGRAAFREFGETELPEGDVLLRVTHSTVNYKDGLCLSPTGGGLVRVWPHVAKDRRKPVVSGTNVRYHHASTILRKITHCPPTTCRATVHSIVPSSALQ
jgi:acrylyl-CoA reductase (NADPH)